MGSQNIRVRVFAAFVVAGLLASPAFAQNLSGGTSPVSAALSRIHIANFGRINDNYFRGSQPRAGDYRDLAAAGVKTVLDLQIDGPSSEQSAVQAAGMKFFRIGMTTT